MKCLSVYCDVRSTIMVDDLLHIWADDAIDCTVLVARMEGQEKEKDTEIFRGHAVLVQLQLHGL